MEQIVTGVPAQKSPVHPRAGAATVADIMRPPLATVTQYDHVAAAAYLMKHTGTTALMVVDAQAGQPAGIITEADVAHAIADGKDANDVRVNAVMTTRPAILTTTTIRDAATTMTARHFRHLPVTGDAGLLGVADITEVCRALLTPDRDDPGPVADPDRAARPGFCLTHRRPASARRRPVHAPRRTTTEATPPGILTPSCPPVTRPVPAARRQDPPGHIMPDLERRSRLTAMRRNKRRTAALRATRTSSCQCAP
jgi:CBS domain-containing protein